MVLQFFRSRGHDSIEEIEAIMVRMLRDAAVVYRAATDATFGEGKSPEAKAMVKGTDKQINRGQDQVRAMLAVHGAVKGSLGTDLPVMLAYMSVVKDIERVGDYAKNLYDLAKYGADLTMGEDAPRLAATRDRVSGMIDEAATIFESVDLDAARTFLAMGDAFLDECDDEVKAAWASQGVASDAVARALFYRFEKRIAAHLMNLVSSLVLPIDDLDYYDEDKEDRE